MQKLVVLIVFLGLLALPLMAQEKVDVFGGYQYLHIGGGNANGPSTGQGFNGWDGSVTGNFSKNFGVTGDFGGGYATIQGVSFKIYTYTGGPVVSMNAGRIKPFAHALFGGAHLSGSESGVSVSTNGYTMMVGGGLDAKVNRAVAVRLIQADWLYYHFSGFLGSPSFSGSNNVRIATGIVLRF